MTLAPIPNAGLAAAQQTTAPEGTGPLPEEWEAATAPGAVAPTHLPATVSQPATTTSILRVDTVFDFVLGGQILQVEGETVVAAGRLARHGQCRIRIFERPQGTESGCTAPSSALPYPSAVVIATELAEYSGPSVTNGAEAISTQVCACYGLDPEQCLFVEHYDDRWRNLPDRQLIGRVQGESFAKVSFSQEGPHLSRPRWQPSSKTEVEACISQKLP